MKRSSCRRTAFRKKLLGTAHKRLIRPGHPPGMHAELERAVTERNAAFVRVRRATGVVVVAGLALTGAFTALAARSTRSLRAASHRPRARVVSARRTSRVVAPAPPLVGVASAAPTPPAPSAPVAAASAPPVVVSGGS